MPDGTVLITGATGYIGGRLVPAAPAAGWHLRVLTRSPQRLDPSWRERVEVAQGDASDADDVRRALEGVEVAYYLLHSMDGHGSFVERDAALARTFGEAAREAGVRRIVYLSGLHPGGRLSEHLASRVEVGEILLGSGVPTAVLQAGVVLGHGSVSFDMLRHLTERLPVCVGPKWLDRRIQPIAVDDVVHYLLRAAGLPPEVNRTIDVGMDEVLTYRQMMLRYASVTGLTPRVVGTVPVLTPELASLWVALVTPVDAGVARPLVGSLVHDAVKHDDDLAGELLGHPQGGPAGFDEAVRRATAELDPKRWGRTLTRIGGGVLACALAGSLATNPRSRWYRGLDTPAWQPRPAAFPVVWTGLYLVLALVGTTTSTQLDEDGRSGQARAFRRALAGNPVANAGWSALFFRAHQLPLATLDAAVLTASGADLARRAVPAGRGKAAAPGGYAAWCAFATALTAEIARRNRHGR